MSENTPSGNVVLEVNRGAVGATRLVTAELPELADGQVRLRVDRFALTANNVTYAVFGDMLGYWDFFPTGDPEWGRVPGIGWAEVVESNVEGVAPGGRYFGWWPMARFHDVTATPTASGLRDDGAHRAAHAPTYRAYVESAHDPMYPATDEADERADLEDRHALLRGLMLTGFLIDSSVADLPGGAPEQLVVLSASAKTSIGLAHCAKGRGASRVVGVTSERNRGFVESLGYYDTVVSYDEVASLPAVPSVVVDMSGDGATVAAVHERLGDLIAASIVVGKSHHDAPGADVTSGPTPEFFFAPAEVERRTQEWGADEYRRRTAEAAASFVEGSREWLRVEHRNGAEAAEIAWAKVHSGSLPPDIGLIVSLHEGGHAWQR